MKKFKEWYADKYGKYPGYELERYDVIFRRMADAFAEYVDEISKTWNGEK